MSSIQFYIWKVSESIFLAEQFQKPVAKVPNIIKTLNRTVGRDFFGFVKQLTHRISKHFTTLTALNAITRLSNQFMKHWSSFGRVRNLHLLLSFIFIILLNWSGWNKNRSSFIYGEYSAHLPCVDSISPCDSLKLEKKYIKNHSNGSLLAATLLRGMILEQDSS